MIEGGAATPQSREADDLEFVGNNVMTTPRDFHSQEVSRLIEDVRKRTFEALGLSPDFLLLSTPSSAKAQFEAYLEAAKGRAISQFKMGACGIVASTGRPHYAKGPRDRYFRVVVDYFDDQGVTLVTVKQRSLRVAKVKAKRAIKDKRMYMNYSFSPVLPAKHISFKCTVKRPNCNFDAVCTRMGLDPKVAHAIAESESGLAKLPFPADPDRPGTLAYWSEMGTLSAWVVSNPSDPFYSTAVMLATHRWDLDQQKWLPVDRVTDADCQGESNAAE